MSEFLKTVSNLGQNFRACLTAIAFEVLEKLGGFPSRRVEADSPGAWLPAGTRGGGLGLIPWGWEGHRERLFGQSNCLLSLQDCFGQSCSVGLAAGSQPTRHKQGEWVGYVLTDCLWLIKGQSLGIFFKNSQGGCVDISTVFKNLDIYMNKEFSTMKLMSAKYGRGNATAWHSLCF